MGIDYKGLAEFLSMSERQIRRWETEKPGVFNVYLNQYQESLKTARVEKEPIIIMALSFKGGVGKSTCCDSLNHYLGSDRNFAEEADSVILNLDLAQVASRINSSYTIDYADYIDQMSVADMIEQLAAQYHYVIIDTPGDPTQEVMEALPYVTRFIVPMTIGERAEGATFSTLNTIFGEGSPLSGDIMLYFFYNAYTNRKKRDEANERFKLSYSKFVPDSKIRFKAKIGSLDASDAISTVENTGKSVFQLARENKAHYAIAAKKITALCASIEEHFDL